MQVSPPRLSKSAFLLGRQCERALWLRTYLPASAGPPPPDREHVLREGDRVDAYARTVYGGGVEIVSHGLEAAAAETREAIRRGATRLYQGTAITDWGGCKVDVLDARQGAWWLREVKSTSTVQDSHRLDLAFQTAVFQESGWHVTRASVVTVDAGYVAPLGTHGLQETDVTEQVRRLAADIPQAVEGFRQMLLGGEPDVRVGPHCGQPHRCPFIARCWAEEPVDSLAAIPEVPMRTRASWVTRGIRGVRDLPPATRLSRKAQAWVTLRRGPLRIDVRRWSVWRSLHASPLVALTFVTDRTALPTLPGVRPFRDVPCAVGLAQIDGGEPNEAAATGDPEDPRPGLATSLARLLEGAATILVYDRPFDPRLPAGDPPPDPSGQWARDHLRRLATYAAAPTDARALLQASERIHDLRALFDAGVVAGFPDGDLRLACVTRALHPPGVELEAKAEAADIHGPSLARAWMEGRARSEVLAGLAVAQARDLRCLIHRLTALAEGQSGVDSQG